MPTSAEEARKIVQIMNDYLPLDKATEITRRLDQEVGSLTDNSSLKISLQMLKTLYVHPTLWNNKAPLYLKLILFGIIGFHMAVLLGNIVAMFILPWYVPWYVALPIISLLINFMFSAVSCPLTKLESFVRKKMGLPEIRYFIQHYFFNPHWRKSKLNC